MNNPTQQVRTALAALSREQDTVSISEIMEYLKPKNSRDKNQIHNALGDLRRASKELTSVRRGVYRYHPKKKSYTRTKMWRILRARKKVTVEDLQELAGASRFYAAEWLGTLLKKGIVRKNKAGLYLLIDDVVIEPIDTARNEKLKAWRKQKKRLTQMLEKAVKTIEEMECIVDAG